MDADSVFTTTGGAVGMNAEFKIILNTTQNCFLHRFGFQFKQKRFQRIAAYCSFAFCSLFFSSFATWLVTIEVPLDICFPLNLNMISFLIYRFEFQSKQNPLPPPIPSDLLIIVLCVIFFFFSSRRSLLTLSLSKSS